MILKAFTDETILSINNKLFPNVSMMTNTKFPHPSIYYCINLFHSIYEDKEKKNKLWLKELK